MTLDIESIRKRFAHWFGFATGDQRSVAPDELDDDDLEPICSPAGTAAHLFLDDGLLHLDGGLLKLVFRDGSLVREFRMEDIRSICVHGRAGITTPTIRALAAAGTPLLFRDAAGRLVGCVHGHFRDTEVRRAQYAAVVDAPRRLKLARAFVVAKIDSARGLLRRRRSAVSVLNRFSHLSKAAAGAADLNTLMGAEGAAAAEYFRIFPELLAENSGFGFGGRNRRPPKDPVNALLSYAYAVVAGESAVAAIAAGLDPHVGFLHAERPGRPALALDLLEPMRAIVAERAVLRLINRKMVTPEDFIAADDGAVSLSLDARKSLVAEIEKRWSEIAPASVGVDRDWRAAIFQETAALAQALRNDAPFVCRLRLP